MASGSKTKPPTSLPTSTHHMLCANKASAVKELQRTHMVHLTKLENMKAQVDMKPPQSYPHVMFNAKRMQMEAERNSAIERENKILLGKMYSIMNSEPAYKTDTKVSVTSLNMTVRKQEYDRIARENQAIMQRILQREPHFDRKALDEDWKVTQRYLNNISEYPFILGGAGHSTLNTRSKKALTGVPTDSAVSQSAEPEPAVDSPPEPEPAAPPPPEPEPAAPPQPEPEPEPAAPPPPAEPEPEAEPAADAEPEPEPAAEPAADAEPEPEPAAPGGEVE